METPDPGLMAAEAAMREELANTPPAEPQPESKLDLSSPVHLTVNNRLLELEQAMANKDPMMKVHLAEIHKHLIQYEEITHLLSDDDIAKMMTAQQIQTNTTLVREVKPTSKATKEKVAKLGMDDL